MSFSERSMQSLWTAWVRKNWKETTAWELKICKEKSLPFSRVEPHQIQALLDARNACVTHKISDMSVETKPFDEFTICNSKAYLVILFYKPRQEKRCYLLDINDWIVYVNKSPRRSITENECASLASKIIIL